MNQRPRCENYTIHLHENIRKYLRLWKADVYMHTHTHTHTHTMEYYSAFKKGILPFTSTWYYPKWNKPDRERQIMHAITYMWIFLSQIYRNRAEKKGLLGLEGRGSRGWWKGTNFQLWNE